MNKVKIEALTDSQQSTICHILVVGLQNAGISCPEDVMQTDRGSIASPEIIENIVDYLKDNDLIKIEI